MRQTHYFPEDVHFLWDSRLEPVLEVDSGATVTYTLPDAYYGQIHAGSSSNDLDGLDWNRIYGLSGPLYVAGAAPGDTLEIEVINLSTQGWGWTCIMPGLGLLEEEFPDAHLHVWDFPSQKTANFLDVAEIPISPFCGTMGVCPEATSQSPIPPGHFGGNVDCRDLVCGSSLFLPVQVPGAHFSVSDPHAAQGDGEICLSAIESPLDEATFRFTLHKGFSIPAPQVRTPGIPRAHIGAAGYYATMGVGPDLMTASRDAARAMIDHLCRTYKIEPIEAYILSSVAVEMKLTEMVNKPNYVVSAYLPLGIFGKV